MKEELQQAFAAIKSGHEDQARVLLAQMLKDDPEYVPGWVLLSKLAPNNLQKAAFLEKILTLDPDHAYARQEMEALGTGVTTGPEVEVPAPELAEELRAEPATAVEERVVAPPEVHVYDVETVEESVAGAAVGEPVEADFEAEEATFEPAETGTVEAEPVRHMPVSEEPYDFDAQAAAETLPPWLAEDEELLAAEAGGDEAGEADRMPPEPELPDWLKEEAAISGPSTAPAGGKVRVREEGAAVSGERPATARRPAATPRTGPPAWLINLLIVVLVIVFLLLVYFGVRYFT